MILETNDESIFGLSKDMDDKTKCRILRQEYSRWNSQTNNSNKDKRIRAKEMVNLIANLRKHIIADEFLDRFRYR